MLAKSRRSIGPLMLLCLSGAVLAACSSRELYEAIQTNRRNACLDRVAGDHVQCLAEYEMDYHQFQQARAEVIDEHSMHERQVFLAGGLQHNIVTSVTSSVGTASDLSQSLRRPCDLVCRRCPTDVPGGVRPRIDKIAIRQAIRHGEDE